MMNILTDSLPIKLKVNDKIYDINYDYKTAIKTLMAFEDEELSQEEKLYILIHNIYIDEVPEENLEEACKKALLFLNCGKEYESTGNERRIYSFKKDGNYIFTGINATHHIDIEKESDLHWWKFVALFMDMSSECMFGELIYYRKRKMEGTLTKDERKQYNKIRDIVELEEVHKDSEAKKRFFEEFYGTSES